MRLTNIVCTGDITGVLIGADGDFDAGDTSVSVPIDAGDDVNCVFTNTEHATLDIDKVTVGGNGTFDYEATGSGIVDVPAAPDFSITTVSNNGSFPDPGVLTFTAAQLDTKTVTETVPTGWSLTNIVCTGDITGVLIGADGDFDAGDTSVSVPIDAGDDVNCVFTNTEHATLDIDKVTVGGNGTFDYEATGSGIVDVPAAPDFSITTVSNNGSFPDPGVLTFTAAQLDTKTVTETVPTGWSLTNIVCTGDITGVLIGADGDFDAGDTSVSVPIDAGDDVNCVFTNTEHATLDIDKVTVGGNGTFDYEATGSGIVDVPAAPDFSITTVSNNGSFPDPGVLTFTAAQLDTKTVTETVPTGWSLTNIVCTGDITGVLIGADGDFDAGDTSVSVPIDAGDDVNCVFTNTELTKVRVIKTVEGSSPTGNPDAWAEVDPPGIKFEIRTGASSSSDGTVVPGGTGYATIANGGVIDFTAELLPGTYQLCELVPQGYDTTLQDGDWDGNGTPGQFGSDWFYPNTAPQASNEWVCIPFTVDVTDPDYVDPIVFNVDNDLPGLQRTIGFWKNWAACTSGNQADVLGQTLNLSPWLDANDASSHGVYVGDRFVNTCNEATKLLDKSAIDTGTKLASNPAFNLSAQYLAHQLNVIPGAIISANASCQAANDAADLTQRWLDLNGFTGNSTWNYSFKTTAGKKQAANLNYLAGILDKYNNDTLNCTYNVVNNAPYPNLLPHAAPGRGDATLPADDQPHPIAARPDRSHERARPQRPGSFTVWRCPNHPTSDGYRASSASAELSRRCRSRRCPRGCGPDCLPPFQP